MSLWQRFKNWITGKSSGRSSSSTSRSSRSSGSRYRSTGSRYSAGRSYSSQRGYISRAREEEDRKQKERAELRKRAFAVRKGNYGSIVKKKDSNESGSGNAGKTSSIVKAQKDNSNKSELRRILFSKTSLPTHEERRRKNPSAKYKGGDLKERYKARADIAKNNPKAAGYIGGTAEGTAEGMASAFTFGGTDVAKSRLAKKDKSKATKRKDGLDFSGANYEKYADKKARTVSKAVGKVSGEIAGSLLMFGGAGKAAEGTVAKGLSTKAGTKAVEKVAKSKLIRKSAEKAVKKGIQKGTIKAGSEELVKEIAKDKSKRLIKNLAENAIVDSTAGALYDFNRATSQHKIGSKEWKKEMRDNALINVGAAGVGVGLTNLKSNKKVINEAVEKIAKREDDAGKALRSLSKRERAEVKRETEKAFNVLADRKASPDMKRFGGAYSGEAIERQNLPTIRAKKPRTTAIAGVDVRKPKALTRKDVASLTAQKRQIEALIERAEKEAGGSTEATKRLRRNVSKIDNVLGKAKEGQAETLIKNTDEVVRPQTVDNAVSNTAETTTKATPVESRPSKNESAREQLLAEREALRERYEVAKKNGENTSDILDEMQETDLMLKDLDNNVPSENIDPAEAVAETPKPKAKKTPTEVERDKLKSERKKLKSELQKAQRAGEDTAGIEKEIKAYDNEIKDLDKKIGRSTVKRTEKAVDDELFMPKMKGRYKKLNDAIQTSTEGEYGARKGVLAAASRSSDTERKRIFNESGQRIRNVLNDVEQTNDEFTYKRLTERARDDLFMKRYEAVKNNPAQAVEDLEDKMDKLMSDPWSEEQITMQDIADMLGVEQVYKEQGVPLPAEYEQAFTRLTMLQKTQHGQGLKATDLFLREHSPRYRTEAMRSDVGKYIERVFGSEKLGDINRSLDANHGTEGWLESEINRIANLVDDDTFKRLSKVEQSNLFAKEYRELQKEIARNTPMTAIDVLNLWRHTGMLGSFATGMRNILGNASQFIMRELSDKMAYFGEKAVASKAAKQGVDFEATTSLALGSKDARKLSRDLTSGAVGKLTKKGDDYYKQFDDPEFAKTITEISDGAVADMMNIQKYEVHNEKGSQFVAEKGKDKLLKGAGWLVRKPSKAVGFMLNEPDSWFVEKRFRKSLMRYLDANGIKDSKSLNGKDDLLERAIAHAKTQALEDTYKTQNRLVSFIEKQRSAGLKHDENLWKNVAKKGGMITLDAELPYLKVPVNVAINSFKYSPLGLAKNSIDAMTAVRRGDIPALQKAVQELSKGVTGTGLAIIGFLANCDEQDNDNSWGLIANAREELKKGYGYKDNSLKIGNRLFDISNIGQGATQLLMGAAAAEKINENGGAPKGFLDDLDLIETAFGTPLNTISDMSIVDNARDLINMFGTQGDYDKKLSESLGDAATEIGFDYVGQYLPQPFRGVARGMTSADLDTNVKKGDTTPTQRRMERSVNNIVSGIPVLNEKVLAHKVDPHGNYFNERKTTGDKVLGVLNNVVNPTRSTKVRVPEVDKIEMSLKYTDKEGNEKNYSVRGYDEDRTFKATFGKGDFKESYDLTRKEREAAARSYKNSGKDMAQSLVMATRGWFGDSHGERAQQILREIPQDEEKAREYLYNTPEFKALDNNGKKAFMDTLYKGGVNATTQGRQRAANKKVYVDLKGGDEGDFKFLNDLNSKTQQKYADTGLADYGITKGQWADAMEAIRWENHKYYEDTGSNKDWYYSAKKVKTALLGMEGLDAKQRAAIYNAIRGKRTTFGWYDWDGVSSSGGRGRRGYRRRGYRRRGRGGRSSGNGVKIKASAFKTDSMKYDSIVSSSSRKSKKTSSKIAPPKIKVTPPKAKKYEI